MRLEAQAIELGDRRDAARHAAERAHVVRREQQRNVARAAALRELDQPLGDPRGGRNARGLERREPLLGLVPIRRGARERAFGVHQLFLLDHAFELEAPELAEHRPRARGELVGLSLQLPDARRRAVGLHLGVGRALGRGRY